VLYAIALSAFGILRYEGHRNFVDLGIFTQTVASAFGCFCNPIEGSHWAVHFSPILYIAGGLFRLWPSPLVLVVLQSAACALAAPPVYALVRSRTDRRTALRSALVVLLYPPLAGLAFNDFHENGLAPAAVLWTLWAFDAGYLPLAAVFAAMTLAIKEDQALFLCVASLYGAWRFRDDTSRRTACIAAGVVSIVVFVLYFALIRTHAAASPQWSPERFYDWTAADVHGLGTAVLQRLGFLALIFTPLLFLPFRCRGAALLMLAPLAEVLLSRLPTTFTTGSHYAGAWAGYVFFAFALGVCMVSSRDVGRVRIVLQWCLALCVLEFVVADPLHPGQTLHARTPADVALDRFLDDRVAAHAAVATQEEAYTHLAARDRNATLLPETSDASITACYILTDAAFPGSPRLVESAELVRRLISSGKYMSVARSGPIALYKRRSCSMGG